MRSPPMTTSVRPRRGPRSVDDGASAQDESCRHSLILRRPAYRPHGAPADAPARDLGGRHEDRPGPTRRLLGMRRTVGGRCLAAVGLLLAAAGCASTGPGRYRNTRRPGRDRRRLTECAVGAGSGPAATGPARRPAARAGCPTTTSTGAGGSLGGSGSALGNGGRRSSVGDHADDDLQPELQLADCRRKPRDRRIRRGTQLRPPRCDERGHQATRTRTAASRAQPQGASTTTTT